jgi:hypothetical protein
VNVYLWDAGRFCGVAGSGRAAVAAAEACLAAGAAVTARVEPARLSLSRRLEPAYERAGIGWTATLDDGTPVWEGLVLSTLDEVRLPCSR